MASSISVTLNWLPLGTGDRELKKEERTFGTNERQTPRERIHEIREPIGMRRRVVLPNRNILVRVLENRATIMVHIKIIRSGEDGDD